MLAMKVLTRSFSPRLQSCVPGWNRTTLDLVLYLCPTPAWDGQKAREEEANRCVSQHIIHFTVLEWMFLTRQEATKTAVDIVKTL